MADELLERIERLESNVRNSLSQLRHLQQLSEAELKREVSDNLEQMRRQMSEVVSRMASLAEVNSLKDDLHKVFDLVGNPQGASFVASPIGGQSAADSQAVEHLTKALQSCEERLDKLQVAWGGIDIGSEVSRLEERLNGLELTLAQLSKSKDDKVDDSHIEDKAKKSTNSNIFDDEPIEWG